MEGPPDGPRIINGIEIVYGTRSTSDMKNWVCEGCKTPHQAIRLLIFDLAPLTCRVCKLPNPNGMNICLANIMINNIPVIDEVKAQKPGEKECVSYSVSHLMELMNRVLVGISSEEPDVEKATLVCDPDIFSIPYGRKFHNTSGGPHKVVHLLQRVTNGIGIRMRYKSDETRLAEEYFQGSEIRMIHRDDFEEVCRQLADGNAVLAPLFLGAKYSKLQFCQFYTSVSCVKIEQRPKVGAICEKQKRAYFGLEAAGKAFCKRVGDDENWFSVMRHGYKTGGVAKISAKSYFFTNFFKLSRPGDEALPPKLYEDYYIEGMYEGMAEDDPDRIPKIDLVLDAEPEDAMTLSSKNQYRISHRYLT